MAAGRRRNPVSTTAIVAAALELLRTQGYGGIVLDEVARMAGVGKSSLYARFPNREELVVAALASLQRESPGASGDLRSDLIAHLRGTGRSLGKTGVAALGAVLASASSGAEERRRATFAPFERHARRLLETARARGELRPGADLDAATSLLLGALIARMLLGGDGEGSWPASAVDALLHGLCAHGSGNGASAIPG